MVIISSGFFFCCFHIAYFCSSGCILYNFSNLLVHTFYFTVYPFKIYSNLVAFNDGASYEFKAFMLQKSLFTALDRGQSMTIICNNYCQEIITNLQYALMHSFVRQPSWDCGNVEGERWHEHDKCAKRHQKHSLLKQNVEIILYCSKMDYFDLGPCICLENLRKFRQLIQFGYTCQKMNNINNTIVNCI